MGGEFADHNINLHPLFFFTAEANIGVIFFSHNITLLLLLIKCTFCHEVGGPKLWKMQTSRRYTCDFSVQVRGLIIKVFHLQRKFFSIIALVNIILFSSFRRFSIPFSFLHEFCSNFQGSNMLNLFEPIQKRPYINFQSRVIAF